MKYQEIQGNLFSAITTQSHPLLLVHCISADAKLGAGIAKTFKSKYPQMVNSLQWLANNHQLNVGSYYLWRANKNLGIANLITKPRYFQKPTYKTLRLSLTNLILAKPQFQTIAMPKIGCGLDRLEWSKVRQIVQTLFAPFNVEVIVYSFKK